MPEYRPEDGARRLAAHDMGESVEDVAHRWVAAVVASPDDMCDVYATEQGTWRNYMIAGNGPTVYIYALYATGDDGGRELGPCFLTYSEWSTAAVLIPDPLAAKVIAQLEKSRLRGIDGEARRRG